MEEQIRQLQHANSTLQREKTDMHNTMVHLQFEQRDYKMKYEVAQASLVKMTDKYNSYFDINFDP